MMKHMKKLAIIGGGASGLTAAIEAARSLRSQAEVTVYEANDRVGRSILVTGNGRCNFSNAQIDASLYRNERFVDQALAALDAQSLSIPKTPFAELTFSKKSFAVLDNPVHCFFAGLGLMWREESEGRLYPLSNKASSVLDVLRAAAVDAGVIERCNQEVKCISEPKGAKDQFCIQFKNGDISYADAVILAVGGCAAENIMLPQAIKRTPLKPVLAPLKTDVSHTKELNNIRVRCSLTLASGSGQKKASEEGELLFRDYGVSGIAVFNLSRFFEPGDVISIDFLPQFTQEEIESILLLRLDSWHKCKVADILRGVLLPQVARVLAKHIGVQPEKPLRHKDIVLLAQSLKKFSLSIRGLTDARQCQVMRGGFLVEGFNPRTMQAYAVPGLYITGESLDVDAPCGGYNLHWAWASGILAGHSVAKLLSSNKSSSEGLR